MDGNPRDPLLKMTGIVKKFPGTLALDKVDFDLRAGEVHVLLGENGAGKSTLMKILSGAYVKDGGQVFIAGREVELGTPHEAQVNGIGIIYQELSQVPQLSVTENIFLGREKRLGPFIDWKAMHREARALLDQVDADFSERTAARRLSVAHRQMAEIAKALSMRARIIVMDEPTSSLTPHEVEGLFAIIRKLKADGVGIVFISHHLEEVKQIGDRATVLRDGKLVRTMEVKDCQVDDFIELMVGRSLENKYPKVRASLGREMLRVEGLTRSGVVENASLAVRQGEVLGLAGLVGAGRTELCRLVFGADPRDSGEIFIDGGRADIRSPEDAIRNGIGFLTENRKDEGLVLHLSITRNISLPILGSLRRGPFRFITIIDHRRDQAIAEDYFRKLDIRAPSVRKLAGELSGGNQQKVVFAKWIASNSKVLIVDEPTRGIDVGAKVEIYHLINNLAAEGVAILMVSSELPEMLGMSDRILVMCNGRITGELREPADFTQEEVMKYATRFGDKGSDVT
ncbi:MAG: sugar ABC transporter ATP-binding protein [Planctomycetota bacterium]|jgi:ribose transport system ATP-binding protein|nr:sugar ABC transporter ATP-binding protein [Planctomycetota bacterium]